MLGYRIEEIRYYVRKYFSFLVKHYGYQSPQEKRIVYEEYIIFQKGSVEISVMWDSGSSNLPYIYVANRSLPSKNRKAVIKSNYIALHRIYEELNELYVSDNKCKNPLYNKILGSGSFNNHPLNRNYELYTNKARLERVLRISADLLKLNPRLIKGDISEYLYE